MKLFKRSNTYKASNVSFNLNTREAHSYDWWCFVAVINGKTVFNSYRYSPSTGKHQSKVARLMRELGIEIDLYISVRSSLSINVGREALKSAYRSQNLDSIKLIEDTFKVKMTQAEVQAVYTELEEERCDDFLHAALRRQDKKHREGFLANHRELEAYLENEVNFRDYEIVHVDAFGDPENKIACKVAVHQVVDMDDMERDVENALNGFHRDGFGEIVFYVSSKTSKRETETEIQPKAEFSGLRLVSND